MIGSADCRSSVTTARVIRDWGLLRELEDEWRSLAELHGNAFLTPEWLYAWLRHYGDSAEPALLEVRASDQRLLGSMPMTLQGPRRRRLLRFAGANLADHLHPLAGGGDSEVDVAATFGARLGRDLPGWSALVLDNVDVGAGWLRALLESAPMRLAVVTTRRAELPYTVLPASWDDYLRSRSRNFRSEVGRKLRRLEREHEVGFRLTQNPGELRRDLEIFFRLHDARWDRRGGSSSLTARSRAFHRDFSASALERDWLRLWTMEVDREPVAAWYGWRVGQRYAYYLAGFSPDWADRSVGFLLLAQTVRAAIEEGASEYDLLRGGEPYKRRFATHSRHVETVLLTRAHNPIRLLFRAEEALRSGYRSLPPQLGERLRSVATGVARRFPSSREK
jgi:CelD/BcsL family acetyltransferase involved in cellulose biosynthesis